MRRLVCCVLLLSAVVSAQEASAPTLTDAQRLAVQNSLLRVENAQFRLQLAVSEAQALVKSLQREGYDLDLDKLAYVKKSGDGTLRPQGTAP